MSALRLCYQTVEFGTVDIHLCRLRNLQEFHDPDGRAESLGISSAAWPLFGVVWPSSLVLARFMDAFACEGKRILEVGCGLAITSLLLNKQQADITATDQHPDVATFLRRNAALNDDRPIAFERTDWGDADDSLGRFDVIIGSDLLYEDQHIALLSQFIEAHAEPSCEVIIVDPGRGRKNKFSASMEALGFSARQQPAPASEAEEPPFKGYILRFQR